MAFESDPTSDLGFQGALLWAEHIDHTRSLIEFLKGIAGGGRRMRGGAVGRYGKRRR